MIPTEGYDTHNKINYDITHLKITKKNCKTGSTNTSPYLSQISVYFIHEIKTKGYNVIGVNSFTLKFMRFQRKKGVNSVPPTG